VILGSPVYFLCAAGSIQLMIPRFFRAVHTEEFKGKPGLALLAAGGPGWDTFAMPQISLLFRFLGMPVIDHVVGYGQGPGEVFYDEKACSRAYSGGAAIARGECGFRGSMGTCPVCHFDFVLTRPDGRAYCAICDVCGQWLGKDEANRFVPDSRESSRISPGQMRKHFDADVLISTKRFQARRQDIKKRLKAFQDIAAQLEK
jgi:Zn-finger nucleic acid-binding protein